MALDSLATGHQRLLDAVVRRGGGSILRGWRREFDPSGALEVSFLDFCKAAARLGVRNVDTLDLFGAESPDTLTLEELTPEMGGLIRAFREWLTQKFGGPQEMFIAYETPGSEGSVTRAAFVQGCLGAGFGATEAEVGEVFNLLDIDDNGSVAMEDVMFLETDPKQREGAIRKARKKPLLDKERLLVEVFRKDVKRGVPDAHRLAPRHWHAATVQRLPALVHEKRKSWQHRDCRRVAKAQSTFTTHLQNTYGNVVRAWRRALDPGQRFALTRRDIGRYCRQADLDVDLGSLWKALDFDNVGVCRLEILGRRHAAALASFRAWTRQKFGTCGDIWERLWSVSAPSGSVLINARIHSSTFLNAIRALGWPKADEVRSNAMLCAGLDLLACGFLSPEDLAWLDAWEAPEWLALEPDYEAWCQLRKLMHTTWEHPLRVWRELFDTNDTNLVSWEEFRRACRRLRFNGSVGGAWRYLDTDLSGTITLQEFDAPSAELLTSFKEWVGQHFGTVEYAFKSIDTDGSGSITYSELRRAAQIFDWGGDAAMIFDCLELERLPGKRTLSFKNLEFLDTWEDNTWAQENALEKKALRAQSPSSATSTLRRSLSSPGSASTPSLPRLTKLASPWGPFTFTPPAEAPASVAASPQGSRPRSRAEA